MAASRTAAVLFLTLALGSEAWGPDGHAIVAEIADSLVGSEVAKILQHDLGAENLSTAATWCDDYDHTPEGHWSEPLHYINYPGQACNFSWDRDCAADWCVVGAIVNYTKQVFDASVSTARRQFALNFVIHMMGDAHQPLHIGSHDDLGGNSILVDFQFDEGGPKRHGKLHAVWDSSIIVQALWELKQRVALEGKRGRIFTHFHNYTLLSDDILKHFATDWNSIRSSWQAVVAAHRNETVFRRGLAAVAGETAAQGCAYAYVLPSGERVRSGDTLDRSYYLRVLPVVRQQLARAGARLAQVLTDALAAVKAEREVVIV